MMLLKNSALCVIHNGKRLTILPCLNGSSHPLVSSFRGIATSCCLGEQNTDILVKYGIKEEKSSKAMRAYLERSQAYNKFMEKEQEEFKTGKRHLANMMGKDSETFSQDDVNAAIAYLFPSGLFVKKTRPMMKPPEEVHPPKKEAEFDETGRPYHYQFYTGKPNFYNYLHNLVETIHELNKFEDTMIRKQLKPDPTLALSLDGYQWCSHEDFENRFLEKLTQAEYRQLITTVERLALHPYSYRVKDTIKDARVVHSNLISSSSIPKPELQEDGRQFVTIKDAKRKHAYSDVTVRSPGTGLVSINGQDINYFKDFPHKEQILFPLQLTGMLNTVDIEATVRGPGMAAQAGAIRYGLSMALRSFVDMNVVEKMRLAGLLTYDRRMKERKKPGQEGARRKFTWKAR